MEGNTLEFAGDVCGCILYEYVYDAVGRRISTKDPMAGGEQNFIIVAYDDNGNVTKRTLDDQSQDTNIEPHKDIVTDYVFDARNRMVSKSEKLSVSVTGHWVYSYGKRDQVTKVTDPEGEEVRTEYNEQLWTTKAIQENGAADVIIEYTYDGDGNVLTYLAKNSSTGDQDTVYTYDDLERVVTITWPDDDTTLYTYDAASNRISTTDPNGTLIVDAYDDNNRLTARDMTIDGDMGGATSIDYDYDGLDRIISGDLFEASWDVVVTRGYNTLGKLEWESQIIDSFSGASRTITYDYDVKGLKTGVTYPVSGQVVTYTRDALDRVDVVSRAGTEVVDYKFAGKRVIEKAFPGSEAEYSYDGFGRVTDIHHKDSSSGNTLARLKYGYEKDHQVLWQDKLYYDDVENTRLVGDISDLGDQYGYDGADRLVTVLRGVASADIETALATNLSNGDYEDLVEYVYDQTGNRTSKVTTPEGGSPTTVTYAYNVANEMTTEAGTTLYYRDNGNYKSKAGNQDDYQYDFANRLVSSGDDGVPEIDWEWRYDAFGRRVVRDPINAVGVDARWYYDGPHAIERVQWESSAETQKALFVYGEVIDDVLEYVDISADPDDEYYVHADRLGSVQVLADDTGAVQESYRYTEFGETTIVDDSWTKLTGDDGDVSPVGNPYMYTGRRIDPQLGTASDNWYYYRARYMRPKVGRFMQADALNYVDGANRHAYSRGNALSHTDPYGTSTSLNVPADAGPNSKGKNCQYLYSGKSDPPSNGSNCHTQLGGGRGEPSSGNVNGLSPFGCLSTFSKEIHIDTKSCGIVDDGNPKTPLLPFPTTAWGNTSFVSGSAGGFQKPVTDPWNVTFGSGGGSSGGSGFAPSFNSSNGDVAPVFMIPPGGLAPGNHAFAKVCWENVPGASSPTCMTLEVCCWCPGAPNGQSPKPPSKP